MKLFNLNKGSLAIRAVVWPGYRTEAESLGAGKLPEDLSMRTVLLDSAAHPRTCDVLTSWSFSSLGWNLQLLNSSLTALK